MVQAYLSNMTIITRLRHFVMRKQLDWDIYVQLSTSAYNTQLHCSMNLLLFRLVPSLQLAAATKIDSQTVMQTDARGNTSRTLGEGVCYIDY